MASNAMYTMMDLLIIISGAYVVYNYLLMKKTGKVKGSVLLPKDIEVEKCRDHAGYIREIGMKQVLFGVAAMICGAVGLIQDQTGVDFSVYYLALLGVFIAGSFWYGSAVKKAVGKYW